MTINTKELIFILDNTPANQNIMLVGKHGIGKSQILENYYASKNEKVVTLFLGQMSDPGDLIGLPEKNEKTGKTDFMLPYWFPTDEKPIILFLDELNRARPEVLQTIMDLTLNRKLAGKSLPKGSRIISAVNSGNEYQLTDLDPALVSRFNIYNFEPTVEDWLKWAEKSQIDYRIINFINENPEFLDLLENDFQSENLERFPDRRSWERVSQIIKNFENLGELEKMLVSGIIGNKATATFFRFISENNLPSAKEILENDFENTKNKLGKLEKINFTQINVSLFKYIESQIFEKAQIEKISENLEKYFDYLETSSQKEMQAHFISLCNAEKYPKTLVFISNQNKNLYKKILDFCSEI